MKKAIITLILGIATCNSIQAQSIIPSVKDSLICINLNFSIIDETKDIKGPHRTPAQVPNVYLNQESSTLLFETPCYECTLELVIPGTETVAYSYPIPDGDDTVQLPDYLSGEFELHIHRGNFCFWGTIEL